MYFSLMIKIVILGAGNVAKHLYKAFTPYHDLKVIQCYNRKGVLLHPDQNPATIIQDLKQLDKADLYILAISDNAIAGVSNQLPFTDRLVVHTSGGTPITTLNDKNKRGVFYPLQTFSTTSDLDFNTIPICIEATAKKDEVLLEKLANTVSNTVNTITSKQRSTLHLAAVVVNNFTNHLFSIGNDICKEHHLPFDLLLPLINETTNKINRIAPNQAQTGPAMRNDSNTIDRHLDQLTNKNHKELYKSLTQSIQSKYGKKL